MKWKINGRRKVFSSDWVEVWLDNVQVADDEPFDHHVIRMPKGTVSAVVLDDQDRVLLLWRHRFITDAWGWEIPAGWVEPGEEHDDAARREVEEETGWRPATLQPLLTYNTLSGITSLEMHTFLATDVERIGPPPDRSESTRIEWVPLNQVPDLAKKGEIVDGPSITGLMYLLANRA